MQLCCYTSSGDKQTKRCLLKSKCVALFGGCYLNIVVTRVQFQLHRYWNGHTMGEMSTILPSGSRYCEMVLNKCVANWGRTHFKVRSTGRLKFQCIMSMCVSIDLDASFFLRKLPWYVSAITWSRVSYKYVERRSGFDRLEVWVLAFGTQVRGFAPSRSRWKFRAKKILSMRSFGASRREIRAFRQNFRTFFAHSSTFRR
jgi:hypothetical protein